MCIAYASIELSGFYQNQRTYLRGSGDNGGDDDNDDNDDNDDDDNARALSNKTLLERQRFKNRDVDYCADNLNFTSIHHEKMFQRY